MLFDENWIDRSRNNDIWKKLNIFSSRRIRFSYQEINERVKWFVGWKRCKKNKNLFAIHWSVLLLLLFGANKGKRLSQTKHLQFIHSFKNTHKNTNYNIKKKTQNDNSFIANFPYEWTFGSFILLNTVHTAQRETDNQTNLFLS